ncbi:MAG TPA: hypothetical protein VGF69_25945 [Thermoanaerobaculia bacterium]|jgi:hypothetical protein
MSIAGAKARVLAFVAVLVALPSEAARVTLFDSAARQARPNCEAHVISRGGAGQLKGPCGTPLDVRFDDPAAFIVRGSEITPFLTDVARGGEFVLEQFAPAGAVTVSGDLQLAPGQKVLLVSFASPHGGLFRYPMLDRARSHPVPAGPVLAVVLDNRDRAVRISPLVNVAHRRTATLSPETPAQGATLLAFLDAPPEPGATSAVTKLTFVDESGIHEPEALVTGTDGIVAVWYGREGRGRIAIDSQKLWLPNADVTLQRRETALVRERLRLRPSLVVEVGAVDREKHAELPRMTLSLHRVTATEEDVVPAADVEPGTTRTFEHVAPGAYDVVLDVDGFALRAAADLTAGDDARVRIPLEPMRLSGTVYRGTAPVEAEIRFLQPQGAAVVKTGDDGRYGVTIWRKQRFFVDVLPVDDTARPPFREMVSVTADRELDFHIPAQRLAARVFDTATSEPIAGAMISFRSSYRDESGREASDVLPVVTTEAPVTLLPPGREGTVELNVQADGYIPPEPVRLQVDGREGERIVDLGMRRRTDTARLEVRLADGRAAAGAELAILAGQTLLPWRGTAGADGVAEVPSDAAGNVLLVRHREGASAVVPYPAPTAVPAVVLDQPGPPLFVHVVDRDGRTIGPIGARITLWHRGTRLTGTAAGFFAWTTAVTATDGTWRAMGLPRGPVRLLATRKLEAERTGALDAFAVPIDYPWPAVATVVLAE